MHQWKFFITDIRIIGNKYEIIACFEIFDGIILF